MSKKTKIENIVNTIIEIEEKYSLLNWKINNVYAWQAARANIYVTILDKLIPNNSLTSPVKNWERIKTLLRRLFINSVLYNPFLSFSKHDVLVFDSDRRYRVQDRFIDIYTHYFCQDLSTDKVSYCLYNTSYKTDKLGSRDKKAKHLDFIYLTANVFQLFINAPIGNKDRTKIKLVNKELEKELDIQLNLEALFQREIYSFKAKHILFKWMFRIKKAKKLFLISSSDKAAIIKAAKDCNMIVSELQHGLIVKEGLISHYPCTPEDSLEYFPNKFYLWKGLNMCTAKLPLSSSNIGTFANQHLDLMIRENKNIRRNAQQILVISQPYSSKELLKFILKNADIMKQYSFVYKIHPAESSREVMAEVEKYPSINNIDFCTNNKSLYQLFSESEYTIGINSSALFEAAYFGSKLILVNLPGVEMASSLIQNGKSALIEIEQPLQYFITK